MGCTPSGTPPRNNLLHAFPSGCTPCATLPHTPPPIFHKARTLCGYPLSPGLAAAPSLPAGLPLAAELLPLAITVLAIVLRVIRLLPAASITLVERSL